MDDGSRKAYASLVTRASYVPGVIILARSLRKHRSCIPLIVLYTSSLPEKAVRALEIEADLTNLVLRLVEPLQPVASEKVKLIAERFADTWTKLRVFEIFDYDQICFVDADVLIRNNMDQIFNVKLPTSDWIAAAPVCVCNLDQDKWCPEDWTPENCPYTSLSHPDALTHFTPVSSNAPATHHLFNSGVFLFNPSKDLWERLICFFNTTERIVEYKLPDQDFLTDFFRGRWLSLPWQFNALKTMRYWHPLLWSDDDVVALHYIVDKPWAARIGTDGQAGYKGKDGETHRWWWTAYDQWVQERLNRNYDDVVSILNEYVADESGSENGLLAAIGAKVQAFASKSHEISTKQTNGSA